MKLEAASACTYACSAAARSLPSIARLALSLALWISSKKALVGTFLRVRTQRATAYEDNHKLQRKKAANCSSRSFAHDARRGVGLLQAVYVESVRHIIGHP